MALKYRGKSFLGPALGRWLADAAPEWARKADLVAPVPAPYWRRVRRGYHPADLIARSVSESFDVPLAALLARRHGHPSQTALDRRQRIRNAESSFMAGPRISAAAGRRILLIDDVCTTGSTLSACAAVLKREGARRVDALVVSYEELQAGGRRPKGVERSTILDGALG